MQKQFLMTINIFLARAISEKNKSLINNNFHSYCVSHKIAPYTCSLYTLRIHEFCVCKVLLQRNKTKVKQSKIYTLNILQALFGLSNRTPPTVLKLGPWNFQHRWPMLWGWSAREDFLIPPPQPAPGSKRCRQIRSGGPSAYFRASFAKYKLLGIVWGVN